MATIAVRTRKGRKTEGIAYSELSLRQNASILEYCRTSVSALSGATAGILGLTGLWGFIFYFITALMLSVLLLLKAGSKWNAYFVTRRALFSSGLFGGLFTYVLFWTWHGARILKDLMPYIETCIPFTSPSDVDYEWSDKRVCLEYIY